MTANQKLIFDLLTALWISILFVILFLWLPTRILLQPFNCTIEGLFSCFVRTVLATVTGVLALSTLGLFNWFTLVLLYIGYLLSGQLQQHNWNLNKQITLVGQNILLFASDLLEPELAQRQIQKLVSRMRLACKPRSSDCADINNLSGMLAVVGLTAVFCFATFGRYQYPLLQLRLGHPDNYHTLLVARQILAGDWSHHNLPVLPSLVATLSLLGAVDPMYVVRFLAPLLGLLLVFSVGYCVRQLSGNGAAAIVAMFSLGGYLFTWSGNITFPLPDWWQQLLSTVADNLNNSLVRQWAGGDLEIGAIFLVCALARFPATIRGKQGTAWIDIICCLVIVGMTAPILLVLAVFSRIGLIVGNRVALAIASIGWLILALAAAMPQSQFEGQSFLLTLGVGLSLLIGLFFALIATAVRPFLGELTEAVCCFLAFSIAINCLVPPSPQILYLEYEIAARKTLELAAIFPTKKWMIVAPVEQFAESYGEAWYEDLALFVNKYSKQVNQPNFKFPFAIPDLFIFVEKIPFATFPTEAAEVTEPLISDSVYRYYRSSAGRASIQFNILKLCESYRIHHADTSIYYENEQLRIYHFRLAKGA